MIYTCSFCKAEFKNNSLLVRHQKTAKYCLEKQKISSYNCSYCSKSLSSIERLETHLLKCNNFIRFQKDKEYTILLENKDKEYTILLENKDKEYTILLENKDKQIKELQDIIEKLATTAINRPTQTTQINNYIHTLKPISQENLEYNTNNLRIEHILKGPEGYAEFALDYPLKDSVVCVDYARRKVKYKDEEGNIITDPKMTKLMTQLCNSVKTKNKTLIEEYTNKLLQNHNVSNEVMQEILKIFEYKTAIDEGCNGVKTDFHNNFIKYVCSKTIKDEKELLIE